MRTVKRAAIALCTAFSAAGAMSVAAQEFPSKPMRFINGFPAGGPADFVSRTIAQKLTELGGHNVIVENRVGAGGMIAAEHVARAPADGYAVYLASSGVLAFHKHLYAKIPIDPLKDLAPVTQAVAVPEIL